MCKQDRTGQSVSPASIEERPLGCHLVEREDELGETAGFLTVRKRMRISLEAPDGDLMGSQLGSPDAAIRHVLLDQQYFCLVGWLVLFFSK